MAFVHEPLVSIDQVPLLLLLLLIGHSNSWVKVREMWLIVYMVGTWWVHGVYMVCTWCVHDVYMVGIWCLYGVYMVCIWCVHGVHMVCIWCNTYQYIASPMNPTGT